MREIKFRQAIFSDGKFLKWHYWGFIDNSFVGVVSPLEEAIKHSQQFTGLHDKNGEEIWEGDIIDGIFVEGDEFGKSEVIFQDGAFSLKLKYGQREYIPCLYEANDNHIKVIGNIYENGDLLK